MIKYDNYDLIGCDPKELPVCSSRGGENGQKKSHSQVCFSVKKKSFNIKVML